MSERDIEAFLARCGLAGAGRAPLAGDASVRRYERIAADGRTLVLMDAPPDALDLGPFLEVGAWLRAQGLSAPKVLAADRAQGFVLLEDLGDELLRPLLAARAADEGLLYRTAVDLLVALQRAAPPALPRYDDVWLLREARLLVEWYAPALPDAAVAKYVKVWEEVLPAARVGADGFVYVDYHADNLLWLPARTGLARVGLLDFQDARFGPPAYDLVSLLADARRDVAPALARALVEHYLAARPELDAEAFGAAYAVLGAQRNAKILGLFARLAARDGKRQYLALQPRVRAHLAAALRHPVLAPLRAWCGRYLAIEGAP